MESIGLKTAQLLTEIGRTIKEDVSKAPVLQNLPLQAIYVLASLYETDNQRASDLSKSIGAAPTSFTPTLDRLEGAGLITRGDHPTDRRSVLISLTREGKKYQTVVVNAIGNAEVRYGGK